MNKPVTIIGGGIGGLSLANALQLHGIPFELYERAPELTEVGAGIGISDAPVHILDQLGLGEKFRECSAAVDTVYMPDKKLNIRRKIHTETDVYCIHRAKLIDLMSQNLPEEQIKLSKEVTGISLTDGKAEITFSDGDRISSGCTVAADGIHSVIRRQLIPEIKIRYISQAVWRGISPKLAPKPFRDVYFEIWDEGLRFLSIPLDSIHTFWVAAKRVSPGGEDDPETVKDDLIGIFRNFHPVLQELIREAGPIIRNDMADLGSRDRPWYRESVCFLGDAIHATTPNLGQGGCQAIEDAWCLAKCLDKHREDLQSAYLLYAKLRKPKAMKIVFDSWWFGRAAHSRNPLFHYAYRALLTHAPEFVLKRQEAFLNDLSYLEKV